MMFWKFLQIENTRVSLTQHRVEIVPDGDSSTDVDAQSSNIKNVGEKESRSETFRNFDDRHRKIETGPRSPFVTVTRS